MTKNYTIAVIADIHFGEPAGIISRRNEIADIVLMRAVSRINRLVQPDVTVILGDVLNDGTHDRSHDHMLHVRRILDRLKSPYIVIPGNHDCSADEFYRVFDRPDDIVEIAGARLLAFVDREEEDFNASRSQADIDRIRTARHGYTGPIISLQHVCLAPSSMNDIPFNYTNNDDIVTAMAEAGTTLSISGHLHEGADDVYNDTTTFVNAPGICQAPFPFVVVTLKDGRVSTRQQELAMDRKLALVDNHVHTQLAYCAGDVTIEAAITLAEEFGLAGITFIEHSGQLYFSANECEEGIHCTEGIAAAREAHNRMPQYIYLARSFASDTTRFGLEAECDRWGNLVIKDVDRNEFNFALGAIHRVPGLRQGERAEVVEDRYLAMLENMLSSGIDVLAHPLRVFTRAGVSPPERLYPTVADLLRTHDTAAEVNAHGTSPDPQFFRLCLERGVKLSFGGDVHDLWEIGNFAYHLQMLRDIGFDGDLSDVLVNPHPNTR